MMKTMLSLFACLSFTGHLLADCKQSGLFLFPSGNTISQNPVFVLDGFGFSEHTIEGLNKDYPVYLVSGEIKVSLTVKEIHKGQFEMTQAVLVPAQALIAGREYSIHIDKLPSYDNFNYHSSHGTWKVIAGSDTMMPVMSSKPMETRKILQHFGCGPATFVVFNCPVTDSSELLAKATVKNLKTGLNTTYYIETGGSEIKLGHSMCHGAFKFNDGEKYEVTFDFMDASGNILEWEGPAIRFTKPTKESKDED